MKRSKRLVDMVKYLLTRPHTLTALPLFAGRYGVAKSSTSEGLTVLRQTLASDQNGILEIITGAAGRVRYISLARKEETANYLYDLANRIEGPNRISPGNFAYLSDILGSPQDLQRIGQLITIKYTHNNVDYVMTIEAKGTAITQAVGCFLNVPFVMTRRRPKIIEESTISVNYATSSSERIEKVGSAERLLPEESNVLTVDDFMKDGGTLTGMEELVKEFKGAAAGMCVLRETKYVSQKTAGDYQSLIKIAEVDRTKKLVKVWPGDFLEQTDLSRFPRRYTGSRLNIEIKGT